MEKLVLLRQNNAAAAFYFLRGELTAGGLELPRNFARRFQWP
jgi:hypothetical protein